MDIKYDLRLPMQIQWWKKTFKERINQERGKGRNSHFSVVFKLSTLFGSFSFPEGNACFNKVFKLTVTNNFQSFLSFALEKKSALKLKAYFLLLGG